MPRSASGLSQEPFKFLYAGPNPVRGTTSLFNERKQPDCREIDW